MKLSSAIQEFATELKQRHLKFHIQTADDADTLVLKMMFELVGNSQAFPTVNVASRLCIERGYAT